MFSVTKIFADRQPEFTQVDIETSFMSEQNIAGCLRNMIRGVFKGIER